MVTTRTDSAASALIWRKSGGLPHFPPIACVSALIASAIFDTMQSMKKTARKKKKGTIDRGENFDEFLARDGLLAETEDAAIKEIIADQIKMAMDRQGLSKTAMAARMKTSRRQLDRLLDPDNPSVTLATLRRAASAVGRNLRVELE